MAERITTVALAIVTLAVVAVVVTSPRTASVIRALGGAFTGALRTAASAGRR